MIKYKKNQKGFVLLIAIIIATILFSIGIGMSAVIYKELILSFTARESMFAFYAADTGAECVLYWDNRRDDTRFDSINPFKTGVVNQNIECDGIVIEPGGESDDNSTLVSFPGDKKEFWLDSENNTDTQYCVHNQVDKSSPTMSSAVSSWGFNSCDTTYQRRIDRAQLRIY